MLDTMTRNVDVLLITVPLVSLLLVSIPLKRRSYWIAEFIFHAILGTLHFVVPLLVFGPLFSAPIDPLHVFLARFVGALYLGLALTNYLARNNVSYNSNWSVFYSRATTAFLLLLADLFTSYQLHEKRGLHPNDKFLLCIGSLHAMWLLGSVVHTVWKSEIALSITVNKGWVTPCLLLDGAFCLAIGMLHFSFPTQILALIINHSYSIDGIHTYFIRMIGALIIGSSIASHLTLGSSIDNKKAHIFGRILTHVLVFILKACGHLILHIYSRFHIMILLISGVYIVFLLFVYGRLEKEEQMIHRGKQR